MKLNIWTRVQVKLRVKNRIVGGIPTSPELIAGWLTKNIPAATEDERQKLVDATLAEVPNLIEEKAGGIANILRDLLIKLDKKAQSAAAKAAGTKAESKSRFTNLKSKVADHLFVEEEKIRLYRGETQLKKPDANEERAIQVMTAQGPRSALKRVDFVNNPELTFTLRYVADGVVDIDLIETLLEHGAWNGLGADRSQGNGLFEVVQVKELEA